ncbi:MAG: hypothetical protein RLZZ303_3129 [Candidatus Hydrogenedentota bacterium]
MRLLIATIDYPPIEGGISTLCLQFARACAGLGHEVTVLAPWFPGMESRDAAEPCRVVRFKGYHSGWLRLLPFLRAAWPLASGADAIVAVNVAYGGVLGLLARARFGIPYLVFAYAYEFLKFQHFLPARLLLRRIYRDAACTVAISQYTRSALLRFGVQERGVRVVYPGASPKSLPPGQQPADVRRSLGLGEAPFVLCLGRFVPRKNHAALIEAWKQVAVRHPNVHLVMPGRGPTRRICQDLAAALGLSEQVLLPGYLDDESVDTLLSDCLFFALPNSEEAAGHVEGFGLVFAEAAAWGKAVLAGDSGGAREAVVDCVTGLLVPPGEPSALEAALLRLIEDSALREQLGKAGRRRVEETLNWNVFTREVLCSMDDALAARKDGSP